MHKTEGIILSADKIGESDLALSVFTRDFGKIICVAQGVRKNDSRLKSILQLGAHIFFHFIILRSGRFRIVSPALFEVYPAGENRGARLFTYLKSLELVHKIVFENQRDEKLWDFMVSWSRMFSSSDAVLARNQERAYLWFLGNLLAVLGHMPENIGVIFAKERDLFINLENKPNIIKWLGDKYCSEFNIRAL